jgi:hypothetical protein
MGSVSGSCRFGIAACSQAARDRSSPAAPPLADHRVGKIKKSLKYKGLFYMALILPLIISVVSIAIYFLYVFNINKAKIG